MVSRYAEKKHRVQCAYANCTEKGTTLVLAHGRPEWVCENHAKKETPR